MDISLDFNPYWQYLQTVGFEPEQEDLVSVKTAIQRTNWDAPVTPLDWNNRAVIELIEAELSPDVDRRFAHLRSASEIFNQASDHPLCAAHSAMISCLTGQTEGLDQFAISTMAGIAHYSSNAIEPAPIGLIYLPIQGDRTRIAELLQQAFRFPNSFSQALLLFNEVLGRSSLAFYNETGVRSLALSVQLSPESAQANLRLGITHLLNDQSEGVFYLQKAKQLASNKAAILQSLYLAYRQMGQQNIADYWLKIGAEASRDTSEALAWQWTQLDSNSPFTYVAYDEVVLAVEPSFNSIVTGVLLAEGDWFEQEMEFWRAQIQPGMTVIDVGANVGVYTFSAARRVGEQGKVLAVEPFVNCGQCLKETSQVNYMPWVSVCVGAASDRDGTLPFALDAASELNRVIQLGELLEQTTAAIEVPCFKLDTLVEREKLQQVDLVKIDAEGHELQVLKGSQRLLATYNPTILYENLANRDAVNQPVADFLQAQGYHLFRYLPFIQQLAPLRTSQDLPGNLNIIAIHQKNL